MWKLNQRNFFSLPKTNRKFKKKEERIFASRELFLSERKWNMHGAAIWIPSIRKYFMAYRIPQWNQMEFCLLDKFWGFLNGNFSVFCEKSNSYGICEFESPHQVLPTISYRIDPRVFLWENPHGFCEPIVIAVCSKSHLSNSMTYISLIFPFSNREIELFSRNKKKIKFAKRNWVFLDANFTHIRLVAAAEPLIFIVVELSTGFFDILYMASDRPIGPLHLGTQFVKIPQKYIKENGTVYFSWARAYIRNWFSMEYKEKMASFLSTKYVDNF